MAAIIKELTIQAAPRRVWDALTLPEEIARWWTDDLSVSPEVGSLAEFRFSQGTFVVQFEVAELDEESKVSWVTRQGPSTGHWIGTSVTWQLELVPNGTQLVFTHDNFAQADRRYEITRAWWEHFLGSLKSYLETGNGTPGTPPFVTSDRVS
ncbi:MAG TPA: SRPBCC domain-containing protein [Ktedonosporobacter sp.]|nr:SRPBCC domain-containing protein [Ktedonosporobacter sp.]